MHLQSFHVFCSVWMYISGAMIISATVIVTVASHRRKSNSPKSAKRRLSFTSLSTMDQDGGSSANGTPRSASERHVQEAGF